MPKLPVIKPKELIRKLHKLGFVDDHQTGSHLIMLHPKTNKRAVVPHHLREIPKGTLNSLLKEAGISREEI
mgnify:CR=1 FL=1